MDENDVAKFNQERWDILAQKGVRFSVPWNKIDSATARQWVDLFSSNG